ncbi:MAG TPA: ankyrin repeat domain-containing protein [Nitrospirota bacterium]|nr:ankyrin repeat domain-containing protein [Nitrospirota bacterium]
MKNMMTCLLLLGILALMTSCAVNILTAADSGNVGDVEKAISSGADVNKRDSNGNTPLMLAAKHGDFAIVKKLVIKGANLYAKNNDGDDALLALSKYTMNISAGEETGRRKSEPLPITTEGHLKTAEYLIQNGVDINEKDNEGNTALILAADLNKIHLAGLLLSKGADVNARNQQGSSALIVASAKGHAELVCPLLKKGADKDAADNQGKTALQYAELYDWKEIIQLLNSPCPQQNPDNNIAPVAGNKAEDRLVEKLLESLKDKEPPVRWEAAMQLGDLKDNRAVVPLINALLSDDHPYVRRRAAFALGELHDLRALDALIKALHDEDSFVSRLASEALEKITGQHFGNDSKKWADWWNLKIRQN